MGWNIKIQHFIFVIFISLFVNENLANAYGSLNFDDLARIIPGSKQQLSVPEIGVADRAWKEFCQLQKKPGSCNLRLIRYYYNINVKTCLPFIFHGCDGNENNFGSAEQCEQICGRYAPKQEVKKPEINLRNFNCYSKPESGLCLAYNEQYFYDWKSGTCKMFIYGGCGGNSNRFASINQCLQSCANAGNFGRYRGQGITHPHFISYKQ